MKKDQYWFAAKSKGWGWSLPLKWQGWVVYGGFIAIQAALFFIFPPAKDAAAFLGTTWAAVLVLVLVCFIKGEPLGSRRSK